MILYFASTSAYDLAAAINGIQGMETMKLYLADFVKMRLANFAQDYPNTPFSMLLSYHYFKKVDLDAWFAKDFQQPYPRVFLDSGAFSARTLGVTIDLDAYARYILRYQHLLETYANLDVIMNAQATWDNQQRLEQQYGLRPLPVFHVTEPWDMLERYLDRYPYIALGCGGLRAQVYRPWLVQCFQRAKGRAVYHGFGMTDWKVMASFPWYSVDSTSWASSIKFGRIVLFDQRTARFVTVLHGDRASCYRHARTLRGLGIDPALFASREFDSYRTRAAIAMLSYISAAAWLTQRWGEVTIPVRSSPEEPPEQHQHEEEVSA